MKNNTITLAGFSRADLMFKIASWAPPKAKSFSIRKITRRNYSVVVFHRNKMIVEVEFFTNKSGKYQVPDGIKTAWMKCFGAGASTRNNTSRCATERFPLKLA